MIDFSDLRLEVTEQDETKGVFKIGPLPRGYGHTLANSLRRVLLSSLEGSAITSVRIAGADHEYSTIEGVKETVVQIQLNVKNVRIHCESSQPQVLRLTHKGKGVVKAGDLEITESVKIINPEEIILTATSDEAVIDMELVAERGIGYMQADEDLRAEAGRLPLDADFSPIERVMFSVDETRKGAKTNLDLIVLTVFTDGSIMPKDALESGIKKLLELFDHLDTLITAGLAKGTEEEVAEEASEVLTEDTSSETESDDLGSLLTEDLPISKRTKVALIDAGLKTLSDIVTKTSDELLDLSGFGAKALEEIKELIKGYGMSLKE